MALVTVTNTSGRSINVAAVGEDGIAYSGGEHPSEATHRTDPLPYPFAHIGTLANSGSKQLPMTPVDFRYSRTAMGPSVPVGQQWNALVYKGIVTFAVANQATIRDVESTFVITV